MKLTQAPVYTKQLLRLMKKFQFIIVILITLFMGLNFNFQFLNWI